MTKRYLCLLWLITTIIVGTTLFPRWGWTAQSVTTRYISDRIRVYPRAGAGTEFKLLPPLSSGQEIKLLGDSKGDWVRISYGKNREGWIQKRFLTTTEPAARRLARAQKKIALLEHENKAKIASLSETNKEYRKGNTALLREVKGLRSELASLKKKHQQLLEESATYLELKERFSALSQQNEARKAHEKELEAECEKLKTAYKIKWFLAGGGVLMLGFLIGLLMEISRNRKRRNTGLSFK
jgi:SH3 domain protein